MSTAEWIIAFLLGGTVFAWIIAMFISLRGFRSDGEKDLKSERGH